MSSRFEIIVRAARDAIVCADEAGKITFFNPAAETLFGYSADQVVGADLTMLMPARFRRAHRAGLKRFMTTGKPKIIGQTIELVGIDKDNVEFPLELSLSAHRSGDKLEAIGIIRDITVRKGLQAKLEEQASTDYLTGLWNRQTFDHKLAEEWQRARRYQKTLSLMMLDLDHFKEYNDFYGHQAGDMALKAIAGAVKGAVRNTDLVARYGGEELAAVLPETDLSRAAALGDRVLAAVRDLAIDHVGAVLSGLLTVSIGIAELSPKDNSACDLLKRTDLALYHAKHSGRNQVSPGPVGESAKLAVEPATKPPAGEVFG